MLDVVWPRCSLREHLLFLKNSFTKSYQLHWNHDIRNAFIMKTLVDIGAPVYTFFSCFEGEWVSYQLIGVFLGFAKTIVGLLLCINVGIVQCLSVFFSTSFGDSHQGFNMLGKFNKQAGSQTPRDFLSLSEKETPTPPLNFFWFYFPSIFLRNEARVTFIVAEGNSCPPTSLMKALGDCIW